MSEVLSIELEQRTKNFNEEILEAIELHSYELNEAALAMANYVCGSIFGITYMIEQHIITSDPVFAKQLVRELAIKMIEEVDQATKRCSN